MAHGVQQGDGLNTECHITPSGPIMGAFSSGGGWPHASVRATGIHEGVTAVRVVAWCRSKSTHQVADGEASSLAQRLVESELSPDEYYLDSMMKPIVEAQNSVTNENTQTLWRLLSYLGPYKKELFWGSLGAVATTLVSLAPAYLSGRLIDEVIRPFQLLAFQEFHMV